MRTVEGLHAGATRNRTDAGQATASKARDERISEAVGEFLAANEAGNPDRSELLVKYQDIADELVGCLDALDFITDVAPQLGQGTIDANTRMSSSIAPLATLGDFRIVRELGRGGMAVVYEAEQLSIGRRVALKVLPFAAMLDKQQLNRFKNEARAAGTLDHPNIVAIFSVGVERSVHFYAMQLVEGESLAQVIARLRKESGVRGKESVERIVPAPSPLRGGLGRGEEAGKSDALAATELHPSADPATDHGQRTTDTQPVAALSTRPDANPREYFRTVARLGVQAAEALDHAHQNGILHRDVKPANLMVDDAGKLWVTDFGLARLDADAGMTMTGDLIGTLRYMSPEQALAKRVVVDHRSDVYSLGATLYELLTLQPVYAADDRQELLRQIAFEEPRKPRQVNSHIPQDLETIVLKAIEKSPADRYTTARDLADDLRRFVDDETIRARRPSVLTIAQKWVRRHRPLVFSAAVSSAALLVLSVAVLVAANARIRREAATTAAALKAQGRAEIRANKARQISDDRFRQLILMIGELFYVVRDPKLANLPSAMLLRDELKKYQDIGVENAPNDWNVWFTRGSIYYQFRDFEKAIADFSQAIELKPDVAAPWLLRGLAYCASEQYEKTIEDLTEAIRLGLHEDELMQAYDKRAVAYFRLHRWEECIADYDKVLQDNPEHFGALGDRGSSHYALKHYDAAFSDFTRAIEVAAKNKNQPFAYHFSVRALCYDLTGRYTEAARDYQVAVALRPNDIDAVRNFACFLSSVPVDSLRDGNRALELATKACELTNYNDANTIAVLAMAHAETGNFDKAVELAETAVKLANDVDRADINTYLESFRRGEPWREKTVLPPSNPKPAEAAP